MAHQMSIARQIESRKRLAIFLVRQNARFAQRHIERLKTRKFVQIGAVKGRHHNIEVGLRENPGRSVGGISVEIIDADVRQFREILGRGEIVARTWHNTDIRAELARQRHDLRQLVALLFERAKARARSEMLDVDMHFEALRAPFERGASEFDIIARQGDQQRPLVVAELGLELVH